MTGLRPVFFDCGAEGMRISEGGSDPGKIRGGRMTASASDPEVIQRVFTAFFLLQRE